MEVNKIFEVVKTVNGYDIILRLSRQQLSL